MSKRFSLAAAIIIGVAAIIGGSFGKSSHSFNSSSARRDLLAEVERDYREALDVVSASYAGGEDKGIQYEKANQTAIQGMLWALDPHSTFFPPDEFRKLREDQDSRFYGIGITIRRYRDGVYIQSPVAGTPASRAGLKYGDRILEVNRMDATEWSSEQVSKNVRGERGEPVELKVERAGSPVPIYFRIVRDSVPLPSIRNAFMIRPNTGYVGLTGGFQSTTDEELERSLEELREQGMRQLILDLRSNPGGLLEQAVNVASLFIPNGKVIFTVRGREYREPVIYKSRKARTEDTPLVVLINKGSASASEIVAGAIQDHGRGLVIGETSFGKGLVQRVFPLPFGNGLTLTTAMYYTPYGRLIQRDYSNGSIYDYYSRVEPEESASPQPPPTNTGPAVKTAQGRVFYGGGGITPDIHIKPVDYTSTVRTRIVEAAFHFTRRLSAGLVPGLEGYKVETPKQNQVPRAADYPVNDKVLEAFRNYIRLDSSLGLRLTDLEKELDIVKLRIKDEIITAAFSSEAGSRVLLDSDPQLLRAFEALPDAKRLAEQSNKIVPVG
jgi:carboxyl-terminal processing protease